MYTKQPKKLQQPTNTGTTTLKNQLRLLWRRELAHIQERNGLYKYKGKRRAFIEKYLLDSVDSEAVKACLIEELFERDYSVFEEP